MNIKDDSKMTSRMNEIPVFQKTDYDEGKTILLLC